MIPMPGLKIVAFLDATGTLFISTYFREARLVHGEALRFQKGFNFKYGQLIDFKALDRDYKSSGI